MLRLSISTQPIKLDYNIQPARLSLATTRPELDMETTPATVEIHQPQGRLEIDQTPCRYSIGLKNNEDFTRDNAQQGKDTVMQAIAQTAEQGDRMAAIQNHENVVANIAAEAGYSDPPDVIWAHIDAPIIRYTAQPVEYDPVAGNVNDTFHPGSVQGDYQRGSVDIRVSQYPSIQISAVDVAV